MSGFASHWFLTGLAVSAGAEMVLFLLTFVVARAVGRWNVVDVTWGTSFAAVAVTSFAWSLQVTRDSTGRRVLVLVMTVLWGIRLASYIAWRSRGGDEDPRYAEMFQKARGSHSWYALRVVFGPQALISWFVSLPVQMAMYERGSPGPLAWVGVALWGVGLFFETVGDAQMSRFRNDPTNRGTVMDRGLWRYTRHPNYFGDACVWFGLYLFAADRWPGVTTILSPVAMLYFLYYKSGKGLLEKSLADRRPGYRDYMQRTSGFIPLPPKR